jgi:hypothetical protein
MTLSEDDVMDLPSDAGILAKVTKIVKETVAAL